MRIRYTCCSHWHTDFIYHLTLRKYLRKDSPGWDYAYDSAKSDESDRYRSNAGGPRLSVLL